MIDPKELIPVKLKDLTDHLREEGSAVVYLKIHGGFFKCEVSIKDSKEAKQLTENYVNRRMLFIRRNRPFRSGV